jgi:hypothetical protein
MELMLELFFRFRLKLMNRLKRLLKTSFITGCLNAPKTRIPPMDQKNIGKGMLASVLKMRYFEDYQIFIKTFEGFFELFSSFE